MKTTLPQVLHTFTGLGRALLEAQTDGVALENAVLSGPGWTGLRDLVETATRLTDAVSDDPLAHVTQGYHRFGRYAPRMLRALEIEAASVCTPLMAAVSLIRDHRDSRDQPFGFVRRNSKWRRLLTARRDDGRLWEVAVLFHLRDAFRSRCGRCHGTGVYRAECPGCGGKPATPPCRQCLGSGREPVLCWHCDGTGLVRIESVHDVPQASA